MTYVRVVIFLISLVLRSYYEMFDNQTLFTIAAV